MNTTPAASRPRNVTSAGPDLLAPGTFGRKVAGHYLVLVYANLPALVMPTLHPKIAHVLSEKDRSISGAVPITSLEDGARRLISTYEMVLGIVFAGPEAEEVAHGLNELHRPVSGSMPDGSAYHAWNKDVWNWTWGGILKGGLDIYEELVGFKGDQQEQAYLAMREIGSRYGVRHLAPTYAEFEAYWTDIVENQLVVGPEVQFIVDHGLTLAKPRRGAWIPTPIWRLLALPLERTLRVGVLIAVPEKFHEELGLRTTRVDLLERRLHGTVMRLLGINVGGQFGPAYFALRRRFGTPGWRTIYSRTTLAAARRDQEAAAKAGAGSAS